jgi:iron complex outermembrane recepter protein
LRPVEGMTIDGWVAYNDAKLTEDYPASAFLIAEDGDRLPYSGKWSGSLSLNQEFHLASDTKLRLSGSVSFVDDRLGQFRNSPIRQVYDDYTTVDLNAELTRGNWSANVYVTNLTDSRGELSGGLDNVNVNLFTYVRPRSIGLSLARAF